MTTPLAHLHALRNTHTEGAQDLHTLSRELNKGSLSTRRMLSTSLSTKWQDDYFEPLESRNICCYFATLGSGTKLVPTEPPHAPISRRSQVFEFYYGQATNYHDQENRATTIKVVVTMSLRARQLRPPHDRHTTTPTATNAVATPQTAVTMGQRGDDRIKRRDDDHGEAT
ncbi:hypothetical protein EI94DRAFT_1790551 [Lactarius quietus]|nr:hypothetical protein EI94DRAFT_1790551 [Lactarius quietus]